MRQKLLKALIAPSLLVFFLFSHTAQADEQCLPPSYNYKTNSLPPASVSTNELASQIYSCVTTAGKAGLDRVTDVFGDIGDTWNMGKAGLSASWDCASAPIQCAHKIENGISNFREFNGALATSLGKLWNAFPRSAVVKMGCSITGNLGSGFLMGILTGGAAMPLVLSRLQKLTKFIDIIGPMAEWANKSRVSIEKLLDLSPDVLERMLAMVKEGKGNELGRLCGQCGLVGA